MLSSPWRRAIGFVGVFLLAVSAFAAPLNSSFTYQGFLLSSSMPANGAFDFEFRLYDASTGGVQIGTLNTLGDLPVTDGRFTADLDFGAAAFAGEIRWLEIRVRPGASTGSYTSLAPRQELKAAPYSLFSLSTGALQGNAVSSTAPTSGQVLKWNGTAWAPAADAVGVPGAPSITSSTDVTGGLLVVGDRLDLAGSGLGSIDAAFVGDIRAPILSQSASTVRIQIPAGVKNGANQVRLDDLTGDTGHSVFTSVKVHRLAIFMGQNNGREFIVDTTDNAVVGTPFLSSINGNVPLYSPAFANNGSLAFIPLGFNAFLWVDMTANPPAATSFSSGGNQIVAFAVSPDGLTVVGSDRQGNYLRPFTITDFEPPYSSPLTVGTSLFLASASPRGGVFVNDRWLAVPLAGTDEIGLFTRSGNAIVEQTPTALRFDTGAISAPIQMRMSGPKATVFALGFQDVFHSYHAAEDDLEQVGSFTAGGASPPTGVVAFDISPNGDFVYIADDSLDRITPLLVGPNDLTLLGDEVTLSTDPDAPSATNPVLRSIAVDPVEGKYLYLGLNNTTQSVDIFDITNGATLTRRSVNPFAGDIDFADCVGIAIQP